MYNIPVYHTMHDNIAWMKKFVDPDFRYHAIIAQVLTRVILLLADSTLLPFNLVRYSKRLVNRINKLERNMQKHGVDKDLDISKDCLLYLLFLCVFKNVVCRVLN